MPTYLTRPVFETPLNWASAPKVQFSYDLRASEIAFAAPVFEPLQTATAQGFEAVIELWTEAEIDTYDTFTAQLKGRLNGFWIPSPFTALQIIAGSSTSTWTIKDQNLRDYLADHPAQHLIFSKTGETDQYGKIDTVTATDGGETLTLEDALSVAVDDTWDVRLLLYVRLADDVERGSFYTDNKERRTLRVIELPTEYTTLETGQQPVYLYRFRMAGVAEMVYWNFTGLNEDITSTLGGTVDPTVFTSFQIKHGRLQYSTKGDGSNVDLTTWFDPASPLAKFIPFTAPRPLYVTIYETTYAAPNTVSVIFAGRVRRVQPEGRTLKATCSTLVDRKFPHFYIQNRCNYVVYSDLCGVNKTDWSILVEITAISGRKVTVTTSAQPLPQDTHSDEENYWSLGGFQVSDGTHTQVRGILQNTAVVVGSPTSMTLRLDDYLIEPSLDYFIGQFATIYPGCVGTMDVCANRFNNRRRYGGHWPAPVNLSLDIAQRDQSLNKK